MNQKSRDLTIEEKRMLIEMKHPKIPDVIAGVQFVDGVKQQPEEIAA